MFVINSIKIIGSWFTLRMGGRQVNTYRAYRAPWFPFGGHGRHG
jgi:hypothetical protein